MLMDLCPRLQFKLLAHNALRLVIHGTFYTLCWSEDQEPPVITIDMGKGKPPCTLQLSVPNKSSRNLSVKVLPPSSNGYDQNDLTKAKITHFFIPSVKPDGAPLSPNNAPSLSPTASSLPVIEPSPPPIVGADCVGIKSPVKSSQPITHYGRPRKNLTASSILKTSPNLVNGSAQNSQASVNGSPGFPSASVGRLVASPPSCLNDVPKKVPKKEKRRKRVKSNCTPGKIKITRSPMTINRQLTEYYPIRRSCRQTRSRLMKEKQTQFEEILLSGKEEGLKVVELNCKGRGVITTKAFKKGEFVVEYSGELIDYAQAERREKLYAQDQNTGCYMYYFIHNNRRYCVDATTESSRLGRLINHSRNGNLVTKSFHIGDVPHLILVAKHDIPPGEELLYDYGDRSKASLESHPWLAM